jgi:hypothetical protein
MEQGTELGRHSLHPEPGRGVFQKNLGKDTAAAARVMTRFDPDPTSTEIKH